MILKIFSAVLFLTFTLGATTAPPTAIQIVQGDLTTNFDIDHRTNTLTMRNSLGFKKARVLSAENMAFIDSLIQKLPVPEHLASECVQSKIEIAVRGEKERKFSCFGQKSITSKQYETLATVLVMAM